MLDPQRITYRRRKDVNENGEPVTITQAVVEIIAEHIITDEQLVSSKVDLKELEVSTQLHLSKTIYTELYGEMAETMESAAFQLDSLAPITKTKRMAMIVNNLRKWVQMIRKLS